MDQVGVLTTSLFLYILGLRIGNDYCGVAIICKKRLDRFSFYYYEDLLNQIYFEN